LVWPSQFIELPSVFLHTNSAGSYSFPEIPDRGDQETIVSVLSIFASIYSYIDSILPDVFNCWIVPLMTS
jgi:hypothetical protein